MKNIDHIGIAVKDIKTANHLYEKLLGKPPYKLEEVSDQNVLTSFFQIGESKVELLQATSEDSSIAKFIEKRGEGIHHLAFEVDDIEATMKEMEEKGFRLLYPRPRPGADGKLINFIHPKDANGVLIEICMSVAKDPT